MTDVESPSTIAGRASASSTFPMIVPRRAPSDFAASTSPSSTSRSAISTRRAKKGMAATVSGTAAATDPIDEPTIARDTGMSSTMRMMNGSDLPTFTRKPSTAWMTAPRRGERNGSEMMPPVSVPTSTTPIASPKTMVKTSAIPTIWPVSARACSRMAGIADQSVIMRPLP